MNHSLDSKPAWSLAINFVICLQYFNSETFKKNFSIKHINTLYNGKCQTINLKMKVNSKTTLTIFFNDIRSKQTTEIGQCTKQETSNVRIFLKRFEPLLCSSVPKEKFLDSFLKIWSNWFIAYKKNKKISCLVLLKNKIFWNYPHNILTIFWL